MLIDKFYKKNKKSQAQTILPFFNNKKCLNLLYYLLLIYLLIFIVFNQICNFHKEIRWWTNTKYFYLNYNNTLKSYYLKILGKYKYVIHKCTMYCLLKITKFFYTSKIFKNTLYFYYQFWGRVRR